MISLRGFELVRARGGGLWLLAVVMFGRFPRADPRRKRMGCASVQKGSFVCAETCRSGSGRKQRPKKGNFILVTRFRVEH